MLRRFAQQFRRLTPQTLKQIPSIHSYSTYTEYYEEDNEEYDASYDNDFGSMKEFETKWVSHFDTCETENDIQTGLNVCFQYDLVPTPAIVSINILDYVA
jgi:hypothetical protein